MKLKDVFTYKWLYRHRYLVLNLFLVVAILAGFINLMVRPIDVLQNWRMELTQVEERRKGQAVYNPGDTLLFKSSSVKLMNANGVSTRIIICKSSPGLDKIEIQLDAIPATRPSGINEPRDNAIFVPDVSRFNGLPRQCKLHIDVCYTDVVLWRDHCESSETAWFIVEEESFDADEARKELKRLNERIKQLEEIIAKNEVAPVAATNTQLKATTATEAPKQNTQVAQSTETAQEDTETETADEQTGFLRGLLGGIFDFTNGITNR